MADITEKDLEILNVLAENPLFMGPTDIGLKLGKGYHQASSYCTNSLKRLLAAGYIEKTARKYKIRIIKLK